MNPQNSRILPTVVRIRPRPRREIRKRLHFFDRFNQPVRHMHHRISRPSCSSHSIKARINKGRPTLHRSGGYSHRVCTSAEYLRPHCCWIALGENRPDGSADRRTHGFLQHIHRFILYILRKFKLSVCASAKSAHQFCSLDTLTSYDRLPNHHWLLLREVLDPHRRCPPYHRPMGKPNGRIIILI